MGSGTAGHRLRVSAWADVYQLGQGGFRDDLLGADGHPVVDDLSLRRTLQAFDDRNQGVKIDWDRRALEGSDESNAAEMRRIIRLAHEELRVQILVGFGTASVETTWLGRWLNQAEPVPNCDALAARIIEFCEGSCPGYDGISLDIQGDAILGGEGRAPKGDEPDLACFEATHERKVRVVTHARQGKIYPCFLRHPTLRHDTAVYEEESLAEYGHRETDFFVWRVTRNLTHLYQTLARKLTAAPQLPSTARRVGYDRIVAFTAGGLIGSPAGDGTLYRCGGVAAEARYRMNDYRAARRDRNLIVRAVSVPGEAHREVAEYAHGKLAASPNFQLGLGDARGWDELAARRLGALFSPPGTAFCRQANAALNPALLAAGTTAGQPLQAPLNQRALEVLKK